LGGNQVDMRELCRRSLARRVLGKDAEIIHTQRADATGALLSAVLITGP